LKDFEIEFVEYCFVEVMFVENIVEEEEHLVANLIE
jgi:hypothetical protein